MYSLHITYRNIRKRTKWKKNALHLLKVENSMEKVEGNIKVLIVEDNVYNIMPIKATLEKNNIEYDIAKNGLMAVERFNQTMANGTRYGIILMDLEMPMMDGFEATESIREIETKQKYPKTYICGLSASTDEETEIKCFECGMDNYVSKPLQMESMLKLITEQFNIIEERNAIKN